jgi:hypothetical protein
MFATLLELQMGPQDSLVQELTQSVIFLGILKVMFIIAAILYVLFSFVVVRQITLMRQTVVTSLSSFLQLIGYIHLIFSILVVIIFFLVL